MADIDYYKILGVPSSASSSEIKARYQELAKKFHPDHSGDDNLMSLINEAYATLSNLQKKTEYDNRAKGKGSVTDSSSANTQRSHAQQSHTYERPPNQQAPPRYQPPKLTSQQQKQQKELQARIKQLEFWIKYPYVLPGAFGAFVIAAMVSSPYVNHATWTFWTIVTVVIFSYFYQQMLKTSLAKVKRKYQDIG